MNGNGDTAIDSYRLSYFLRWSAIVLTTKNTGKYANRCRETDRRPYFLVAWGRSSSSLVLVWKARVWPVGKVRLPLPRRDEGMVYIEQRKGNGVDFDLQDLISRCRTTSTRKSEFQIYPFHFFSFISSPFLVIGWWLVSREHWMCVRLLIYFQHALTKEIYSGHRQLRCSLGRMR